MSDTTTVGNELRVPVNDGMPALFQLRNHGVVKQDGDGDDPLFVCSPLHITALTRDATGDAWGRLLTFKDPDGNQKNWAMPMSLLSGDGREVREVLLNGGLIIGASRKARDALTQYICDSAPTKRVRCVRRVGWNGDLFVLPDATFPAGTDEQTILQSTTNVDTAFRVSGSLSDWQDTIARPAAGNSRLVLSISIAFATPLLKLVGAESGGIHFRGNSSTGKTTALMVAGSVWGGGGKKGYLKTWRATDNGLEAIAAAHCDTLLCLDEISQVTAAIAGATAYTIANGSGKERADQHGNGRRTAEWQTLFISTGEVSLADKIAEDGRRRNAAAGQEVRVLDLAADAGAGCGLFENLHEFSSGEAFSSHLREATKKYYGTAAREFLRILTADQPTIIQSVSADIQRWVQANVPAGADGQVSRAAKRFALVAAAGEAATRAGILPWPPGEASAAAAMCFAMWVRQRGGVGDAETKTAIETVRLYIETHGAARFAKISKSGKKLGAEMIHNRAGWLKQINDEWHYVVLPEVWKSEVCRGLNPDATAQALVRQGLLLVDKQGKRQVAVCVPDHKTALRAYVIKPGILASA